MTQLTDGIAHAHEAYIIHRDIKPQNIMIEDDGRIKITDFGVSGSFDKNEDVNLRIQGTQVGTLPFMPQEILHGAKYKGPEVDVYSLGVTFFEMMGNRSL